MDFFFHGNTEETPLDRELQSRELGRIMSEAYPNPFIFLGYVVTQPHAARREFEVLALWSIDRSEKNMFISCSV